jgi:hypothetical protein
MQDRRLRYPSGLERCRDFGWDRLDDYLLISNQCRDLAKRVLITKQLAILPAHCGADSPHSSAHLERRHRSNDRALRPKANPCRLVRSIEVIRLDLPRPGRDGYRRGCFWRMGPLFRGRSCGMSTHATGPTPVPAQSFRGRYSRLEQARSSFSMSNRRPHAPSRSSFAAFEDAA